MPALGFVGDVMLGRNVDEAQRTRPPEAVWGDVRDRLQALEGLFVNLECTLSTRGEPWTETRQPYRFRADPDWAVPALRAAGVDYCSLANNHLLDFDDPALLDTLATLDDAGIAHAGAGRDREQARRPATVTVPTGADDSLAVACVALTDNRPEFAAGDDEPGVAHVPDTGPESRETVAEMLASAAATDPDLLVASLHWGPNMKETPDDDFRAFCRWLADPATREADGPYPERADGGIDVVHGHSAHVFQGVETHAGSLLAYDMGDFVDDYAVDRHLHNDRSFLFEVAVTAAGDLEGLRLVPTEIRNCRVHLASDWAAAWSRKRMRDLSEPFGTTFDREGDALVLSI